MRLQVLRAGAHPAPLSTSPSFSRPAQMGRVYNNIIIITTDFRCTCRERGLRGIRLMQRGWLAKQAPYEYGKSQ